MAHWPGDEREWRILMLVLSYFTESHLKSKALALFTCDVEILDWSWRAVRSEEDTLAGAPRWSRMLTFLSLSAREIARGDVLPKIILCATLASIFDSEIQWNPAWIWTDPTAGLVRQDWRWPGLARFWLCWQHQRSDLKGGPAMRSPGGLPQSSHLSHHPSFSPVLHPQPFDWHPGRWEQLHYSYRINKHVL